MDRSIPNHLDTYLTGIYLNSEGPMHIHNVEFKDFKTNEFRPACGIQFKDDFRLGMGPSSTVKGKKKSFKAIKSELVAFLVISNGSKIVSF